MRTEHRCLIRRQAARYSRLTERIAAIDRATHKQHQGRKDVLASRPESGALRRMAERIKQHTIDHLPEYLDRFADQLQARGAHVHWAGNAAEARRIIAGIATSAGARTAIKSKSMTSEEIELNPALEAAGVRVVETDLAEIILQLDHGRPSHLVTPAVHYTRERIGRLFAERLGIEPTDDPKALTAASRRYLREQFPQADLGLCGVNLAVAEDGTLCVVTNEGNARYVTTLPRTLVALVGAEKLIPRRGDLALFLEVLARSATGQEISAYTNLVRGPRRDGERDGPEALHVVILDNGRSGIQQGAYRETLRCLRCGACLNACPVYRKAGGGHAYEGVYQGPIGALQMPLFAGLERYPEHAQASSLCGACLEACPVRIPIPQLLVRMRADIARQGLLNRAERWVLEAAGWVLNRPWLYRLQNRLMRWFLRRRGSDGWLRRLPGPLRGWTDVKDFPMPAKKTFQERWRERGRT